MKKEKRYISLSYAKVYLFLLCFFIIVFFTFILGHHSVMNIKLALENSVISSDCEELHCTLTNHTFHMITYGDSFHIEYYDNGSWLKIDSRLNFESGSRPLRGFSAAHISYNLSKYFSHSDYADMKNPKKYSPGKYRVVIEVSDHERTFYTLVCPFTVAGPE